MARKAVESGGCDNEGDETAALLSEFGETEEEEILHEFNEAAECSSSVYEILQSTTDEFDSPLILPPHIRFFINS